MNLHWLVCAILALLTALILFGARQKSDAKQIVNGPRWFEPQFIRRLLFLFLPVDTIPKARQANKRAFKLLNYSGEVTVLPSDYADVIGNERRLTLDEFLQKEFHTHIPGLTPVGALGGPMIVQKVVKRFTRNLAKDDFRSLLASQTVFHVDTALGHNEEWREIVVYDFMLDTIARLDVRAIWGQALCDNDDWLKIAKTYTPNAMAAAVELGIAPWPLRPLVCLLSPHHRRARWAVRRAREILVPIVQERRELKPSTRPTFDDALEWVETEAGTTDYNIEDTHMALMSGAVHTSSDLCTQVLILLAQREDTVNKLRSEIETVLSAEGLTQNAFRNMQLVDSVLKETLRLKPASNFSMQRRSKVDVYVDSNLTIQKGETVAVDLSNRLDPQLYPNPNSFVPDRFLRLRQDAEYGSKALFVTTSSDHLAFGHGHQACPGRFFVDLKLKTLLCHLLLTYDWQLAPGTDTRPYTFGVFLAANMTTRLLFRRREMAPDLRKY